MSKDHESAEATGEGRAGEPESKSGYRTIPLTDEGIALLRKQKQKNAGFKVVPMEKSKPL